MYYLAPLDIYKTERPYHINVPPSALPPGQQSNEVSRGYDDIKIEDLRGREHSFNLDDNGFQIFEDDSSGVALGSVLQYADYANPDIVKHRYRAQVEEFIKQRLGAEEVFPFTHEVSCINCLGFNFIIERRSGPQESI